MVDIPISADTSAFDYTVNIKTAEAAELKKKVSVIGQELRKIAGDGLVLTSMLLSRFREVEGIQGAIIAQTVALTTRQIVQTGLQAQAAFISGDFVRGSILLSIAGLMTESLVRTEMIRAQNERLQQHTDNINRMRDNYS